MLALMKIDDIPRMIQDKAYKLFTQGDDPAEIAQELKKNLFSKVINHN